MATIDIYWQDGLFLPQVKNMENTTVNISMPKSMKNDVDEIIEADGYGNTSEFFRDLVRDHISKRTDRRLEELILEGLNSGPATPLTKKDFDDIKKSILKKHAERIANR